MPKMSGVEFLTVVRRRFPKISVIASSGAHGSRCVPPEVLADAFFAKGQENTQILLATVADLIQTSAARTLARQELTTSPSVTERIRHNARSLL
jgi:hypothetical protein